MSVTRTASIQTTQYQASEAIANSAENAHVLRFNFSTGQQVYIPSQSGLNLPSGAYESKARIAINGISSITENAGVQSNVARISGCTVTLADVDHDLSSEFASKLANNIGTRHKKVEIFAMHPDSQWSESNLIYTFILQNYDNTKDGKRKILYLQDVARQTTRTIFDEKVWNLRSSITANSESIDIIAGDDDDFRFQRSQNDPYYPNQRIGYMRFGTDGEIWSYSSRQRIGTNWYRYTVKDRGLFNTVAQAFEIEDDTPEENRQKVKEFIYYNEDVRDALIMATTGVLADGRVPPEHWSPRVSEDQIDSVSIYGSNYTHRVEVEEPGSQEAKTFYEKYLLPTMNDSVMRVDAKGRLKLQTVELATPNAQTTVTFDRTNIDLGSLSPLKVRQDDIANPISILWDYNPASQDFANRTIEYNLETEAVHGEADSLEIEMPAFHSGTHTATQLRQKILAAAERHGTPTVTISFDARQSYYWVEVGTVVRLKIDDDIIIDDTTGSAQSIDRAFLVIGRRYDPGTRKLRYFLWGTSGRAVEQESSRLTSHIPDAEFKRGAQNFASVVNITNGVASGTQSAITARKYYYEGDLTLGPDFFVPFGNYASKFQLCVLGVLDIQSPNPFGLKGFGVHAGGVGQTQLDMRPGSGSGGYFGRSAGGGGFNMRVTFKRGPNYRENIPLWSRKDYTVDPVPGYFGPPPTIQSVPVLDLALNDNQFTGVPGDLSGSGGSGGRGIRKYDSGRDGKAAQSNNQQLGNANTAPVPTTEFVAAGQDGERGGMGCEIWSRGGGFSAGGGMVLDGADATAGGANIFNRLLAGPAGRSMPGVFIWIQDDPRAALPDVSSNRVSAFPGRVSTDYIVAVSSSLADFSWPLDAGTTTLVYSSYRATERVNYADIAARAQYSPAPARVERSVSSLSLIEQFLATQIDSHAKLFIGNVDPSNGNKDDMLITQARLDSGESNPPFRIFTGTQWRDYVYGTDPHQSFYGSLIALNREFGTTEWHYSDTRPTNYNEGDAWTNTTTGETFLLYSDRDDVNILDGDTYQGDERNPDPNFSLTKAAGQPYTKYYHFTTNINILPEQSAGVVGIVGPSGGSLDPPINVRGTVSSGTSGALTFGFPFDTADVTKYGMFLGLTRVGETTGGYYAFSDLTPSTQYNFGVRSENDSGNTSSVVYASVTTQEGTGSSAPNSGSGSTPTITLTSSGPTVSGSTTNVEVGRNVYLSLWDTSVPVDSSGNWSYTPATPANWDGQTFNGYVENDAGFGSTIPNQPIVYNS